MALLHGCRQPFAPVGQRVAGAFHEVEALHRWIPNQVIHREDERIIHQTVDGQSVLVRIDTRYTIVMAFENRPLRVTIPT